VKDSFLTRRALLSGGLASVALGVAGCSGGVPGYDRNSSSRSRCVDKESLTRRGSIGAATLIYEVSERAEPLYLDATFADRLEAWWASWNTLSRYGGATQMWNYGSYVTRDCSSWHAAGRALDISRLRGDGNLLVSCRTDLWDDLPAARVAQLNREYWTLAASLHMYFAYVLTRYFDSAHANHIHVDNSGSGDQLSVFNPRSRVQNQAVQAIATHVWGIPTDVTGQWRDAEPVAGQMLQQLGLSGNLTRGDNWQLWLKASVTRG